MFRRAQIHRDALCFFAHARRAEFLHRRLEVALQSRVALNEGIALTAEILEGQRVVRSRVLVAEGVHRCRQELVGIYEGFGLRWVRAHGARGGTGSEWRCSPPSRGGYHAVTIIIGAVVFVRLRRRWPRVERGHEHAEHILGEEERGPGLLAAHVALVDRVKEPREGPRVALGEVSVRLVKQERGRERREARHGGLSRRALPVAP